MEYEQATGRLRDASDAVIGIGYSGAPAGKNDPLKEGVEFVGPIPCGKYRIQGPPWNSDKHGPYCLRLAPDDETRARILTLGRDPNSFLMHGDKIGAPGTASEGCIVADRGTRENVWGRNATDPYLTVVSGLQESSNES